MRMRVLFGLASVAAIMGMLWGSATPAEACSAGPDYDPIADSEVIVAGRFTGWQLIENARRWDPKTDDEPIDDPNYYGPYEPIRVHMEVERIYKGTAANTLEVMDGASLHVYDHEPRYVWAGSSGACGVFDEDPTDQYAILGLNKDAFGRYRPNLTRVFYLGDNPPSQFDSPRLSRLAPLMPGSLPISGEPSSTRADFPYLPAAIAATLGPLAFLAGAAFVWRRGEPHTG